MGNIVLLDDNTINKIAAGEVIERPASVVKELMENSIDAGATSIKVEIKNGGISYIRITDNGKGIATDDMEIAFERHATSKIRQAEDLEKVTSMGFRGEALASIAAISKIEMVSKTANSELGYKIEIEGGRITNKEEAGCPKGTTITIQDLFFNTPVRYKFLKKDFTEAGYIEDAVTRIALVHPEIAIQLINSGKTIIQTPGNNDSKTVIYSIYGKDVAENILDVNYEYEDIKITGVIGKPVVARSNRSNQLFFVNKRYVKDKTLTGAAEAGYKGLITIGKYGFLVLNLAVNPQKVDVNVHPAKLEVRFEEEGKIFKAVYHAIKDTLLRGDLIADTESFGEEKTVPAVARPIDFNGSFSSNKPEATLGGLFKKIVKDQENNKKLEETASLLEVQKAIKEQQNSGNIESLLEQQKKQSDRLEEQNNGNIKGLFEKTNTTILGDATTKISTEEIKQIANTPDSFIDKQETADAKIDNSEQAGLENKQTGIDIGQAGIDNLQTGVNEGDSALTSNQEGNVKLGTLDSSYQSVNNREEIQDKSNLMAQIYTNKFEETDVSNMVAENTEDTNYELPVTGGVNETIEKPSFLKKLEEQKEKMGDTQMINTQEVSEKLKEGINQLENLKIEEKPENFDEMYIRTFGAMPSDVRKAAEEEKKKEEKTMVKPEEMQSVENMSIFPKEEKQIASYKFIGIAFSTYIILELEKELYILDQHAAHERILYEKVKKNYYSNDEKDSQLMLLPDIISLSHKEMDIAKENMEMFRKAGFTLDEFGENTIKLSGVPNICLELDTKELFLETLDEINTVARTAKQEKEEKFIATVACKAAVKANMALTREEVDHLMEQLLVLPNPFTCPHGRPTAIKMTKTDIEKKFSRR